MIDPFLLSIEEERPWRLYLRQILARLGVDRIPSFPILMLDFFSRRFPACLKLPRQPSRDNDCKASYPRTQQRDQVRVQLRSCDQDRRKRQRLYFELKPK